MHPTNDVAFIRDGKPIIIVRNAKIRNILHCWWERDRAVVLGPARQSQPPIPISFRIFRPQKDIERWIFWCYSQNWGINSTKTSATILRWTKRAHSGLKGGLSSLDSLIHYNNCAKRDRPSKMLILSEFESKTEKLVVNTKCIVGKNLFLLAWQWAAITICSYCNFDNSA